MIESAILYETRHDIWIAKNQRGDFEVIRLEACHGAIIGTVGKSLGLDRAIQMAERKVMELDGTAGLPLFDPL